MYHENRKNKSRNNLGVYSSPIQCFFFIDKSTSVVTNDVVWGFFAHFFIFGPDLVEIKNLKRNTTLSLMILQEILWSIHK
jgi:hypothetical protein